MDALLQRLEVQAVVGGDDDLAVDHATRRQLGAAPRRPVRESIGSSARSLRLPSSTWSPSRKQIDLKPSHLGSYDASGGIDFTDLASIGEIGGMTGKSIDRLIVLESEYGPPAEEIDVDGIAVRLTNPDKVYFPKLGSDGTKRRLVEYYRAVASGPMLASLRDRPCHLQRFPDGIDGEEIYQKRIPQHHPDYLETCRITFPSGRTADALRVTHPSAIVWAAQMGTITLHPWQVRCPDAEHPDELRVDLDPQPGTGFAEARVGRGRRAAAAARRARAGGLPEDVRAVAGSTSSCGSRPTGISSRCAGPVSRWPAKWSAAHRTR